MTCPICGQGELLAESKATGTESVVRRYQSIAS